MWQSDTSFSGWRIDADHITVRFSRSLVGRGVPSWTLQQQATTDVAIPRHAAVLGGDSSETHRVTQVDSAHLDVLAALERDLIEGPRQTQVDSSLQGSTAFDLTVDDSDNVGEDCDTVLRAAGGYSWFSRSPGGSQESITHASGGAKQVLSTARH